MQIAKRIATAQARFARKGYQAHLLADGGLLLICGTWVASVTLEAADELLERIEGQV